MLYITATESLKIHGFIRLPEKIKIPPTSKLVPKGGLIILQFPSSTKLLTSGLSSMIPRVHGFVYCLFQLMHTVILSVSRQTRVISLRIWHRLFPFLSTGSS